jgi:VWFA-related protein
LEPTADRERILAALGGLQGLRDPPPAGSFHVRNADVIDYVASRGREHDAIERRYCPDLLDKACAIQLNQEISTLVASLEAQARSSLGMLESLVDALADLPGRKVLVLVSAGMIIGDRPGSRPDVGSLPIDLGHAAARANMALYTLFLDGSLLRQFAAENARGVKQGDGMVRDGDLAGRWLDQFSGAAGGAFLKVLVGQGDTAYARIARETSAYYVLGVEVAEADRTGKARSIRVRVRSRGATVRSRQWVIVPKG